MSAAPCKLADGQVWRNRSAGRTAAIGPIQPKERGVSFGLRGRHRVVVTDDAGRTVCILGLNPWDTNFLLGMGYTPLEVPHAG